MARLATTGRPRGALIMGVSLIGAIIAAYAVFRVLQTAQDEVEAARQGPSTIPVVIATRNLDMGLTITDEDVTIRHLLPEMVPEDDVYTDSDIVIGRTPRSRILVNEMVRRERLAAADAGVGLNALIRKGMRAMTVNLDQQSGVGGFIQPGNYVDVIVTIRPDDQAGRSQWATETILSGIPVLTVATGEPKVEKGKDGEPTRRATTRRRKPSVTLELTTDQTEKLALAVSKGDIHLVLRGDLDITSEDGETTSPLSTSELIGYKAPRRVGRQTFRTAEVIQGSRTDTARFDRAGKMIER
jgi:pilus assembly protein CpaB